MVTTPKNCVRGIKKILIPFSGFICMHNPCYCRRLTVSVSGKGFSLKAVCCNVLSFLLQLFLTRNHIVVPRLLNYY